MELASTHILKREPAEAVMLPEAEATHPITL
jgi:hypothetical protein